MSYRFGQNENSNAGDLFNLVACFDSGHSPWIELARAIGPHGLAKVLEVFGGQKIHVPTLQSFQRDLERTIRDEEIRRKFRGNNYAELAIEYQMSQRRIREIVHGCGGRYPK